MSGDHPFLNQARRDLARVEASRIKAESMLRACEQEIFRLKLFIETYEAYAGEIERSSSIIRSKFKSKNITDIAVSIIELAEGPLLIQEILDRLYSSGIEVGGENKSANLAAYLSKDNRVKYERGLGWMPSGDPFMLPDRLDVSDGVLTRESQQTSVGRPDSDLQRRRAPTSTNIGAAKQSLRTPRVEIDDDIPF